MYVCIFLCVHIFVLGKEQKGQQPYSRPNFGEINICKKKKNPSVVALCAVMGRRHEVQDEGPLPPLYYLRQSPETLGWRKHHF